MSVTNQLPRASAQVVAAQGAPEGQFMARLITSDLAVGGSLSRLEALDLEVPVGAQRLVLTYNLFTDEIEQGNPAGRRAPASSLAADRLPHHLRLADHRRELSKSILWLTILALIGISAFLVWSKTRRLSEESAALGQSTGQGQAPPGSEAQSAQPSPAPSLPPPSSAASRETGECSYEISYGRVFHYTPSLVGDDVPLTAEQQRHRVEVTGIFFGREPEVDSPALVLPVPEGDAVCLRIVKAVRDAEAPPPELWMIGLEEASHTSLRDLEAIEPGRRPEVPRDAVVIWPLPENGARFVDAARQELPPDVAAETVRAAVDLDADGSADLLAVEFCCGERTRLDACEYHCGETWQRHEHGWTLCTFWQPA